jgi:hypothetical protein
MQLTSATEIIDKLGGNPKVAEMTGRTSAAVSNWRAFNSFPANTFLILTSALDDRGFTAPVSLWRMTEPA